jgi:hypothetical protein
MKARDAYIAWHNLGLRKRSWYEGEDLVGVEKRGFELHTR